MPKIERIIVPFEKKFLDLDIEKVLGIKVLSTYTGIKSMRTDGNVGRLGIRMFALLNRLRNANGDPVIMKELIDDVYIDGIFHDQIGTGGPPNPEKQIRKLVQSVNEKLEKTYGDKFKIVHILSRGYSLTRKEK